MTGQPQQFISGLSVPPNDYWAPIIISGETIQAEVERLLALDVEDPIERQSRIVHPMADGKGMGLAPGIEVRLSVLKPGEKTRPFRHNATEVGFCIQGTGVAALAGAQHPVARYDVWNNPSWTWATYENTGDEPLVRFNYSNAPLLRMLNVYLTDHEGSKLAAAEPGGGHALSEVTPTELFRMDEGQGPWLMTYERLINPPAVESSTHHWRWEQVKTELDKLTALGPKYRGRRLYLLYNPLTGRTNGTTPSFFATMTVRPPRIIDRPHRHVSAAINYYFTGAGYSRVAGEHYEWKAGDLMLSAPGWAVHNHASHDQGPVYELTIQDQPFHIWQESLLWQESLAAPPLVLGAQTGFSTNRSEAAE